MNQQRTSEFTGRRGVRGDPYDVIHLEAFPITSPPFPDALPRLPPLVFRFGFELGGRNNSKAAIFNIRQKVTPQKIIMARSIAAVRTSPTGVGKQTSNSKTNITYSAGIVAWASVLEARTNSFSLWLTRMGTI